MDFSCFNGDDKLGTFFLGKGLRVPPRRPSVFWTAVFLIRCEWPMQLETHSFEKIIKHMYVRERKK